MIMNGKIRELQALIENLEEGTPLRCQLEAALLEELTRQKDIYELEKQNEEMGKESEQFNWQTPEPENMPDFMAEEEEDDEVKDGNERCPDEKKEPAHSRRFSRSCGSSGTEQSEESDRTGGDVLKELGGKFGNLLNNDEFITASAGFVLGAAAVGLGVLAYSVIKK